MTIDLKLPSNEIMHFFSDSVVMTERDKLRGLLDTAVFTRGSPFVKRSKRYDLSEFMNKTKGVMNSPGFIGDNSRLDKDNLTKLQSSMHQNDSAQDLKSVRSKRSLSINVNKISKIVRMKEDGVSALSKAKDGISNNPLQNKSTERAASRGLGSGIRRIQ